MLGVAAVVMESRLKWQINMRFTIFAHFSRMTRFALCAHAKFFIYLVLDITEFSSSDVAAGVTLTDAHDPDRSVMRRRKRSS
jgi:hypothetical protein